MATGFCGRGLSDCDDSRNFCREKKQLCTNTFVIMPTPMQVIVFDTAFDNERLQRSLADFHKFTGWSLSECCGDHMSNCFVETLRVSATAVRERRFWQTSRHPVAFKTKISGDKCWITWTRTLVAKGMSHARHTGAFRRRLITFRMVWRLAMCESVRLTGRKADWRTL